MGIARPSIVKLVNQGMKASGHKVINKADDLMRYAHSRFKALLGEKIEVPGLPGVTAPNPAINFLSDINTELADDVARASWFKPGEYMRPDLGTVELARIHGISEAAHESAHGMYLYGMSSRQRAAWDKAVKTYGRPFYGKFKSHPWASDFIYQDLMTKVKGKTYRWGPDRLDAQSYVANTEALAYTLQDLVTPGQEIRAPLGFIRELEKIFQVRGLIDRVAHRLPPPV
jgi:hypothetical protein